MSFTDEDLKSAKLFAEIANKTPIDLLGLIDRLEAAEGVLNGPAHHYSHHYPEEECVACGKMAIWRKAAGR